MLRENGVKTSRDICKECLKRRYPDVPDLQWSSVDEAEWEKGSLMYRERWQWLDHRNHDRFPPSYCPYITEHVVLREKA